MDDLPLTRKDVALVRLLIKLPIELHADTTKVLSGYWYRSERMLATVGELDTPVFGRLAYEYTRAREERGDERQAPIFLPEED